MHFGLPKSRLVLRSGLLETGFLRLALEIRLGLHSIPWVGVLTGGRNGSYGEERVCWWYIRFRNTTYMVYGVWILTHLSTLRIRKRFGLFSFVTDLCVFSDKSAQCRPAPLSRVGTVPEPWVEISRFGIVTTAPIQDTARHGREWTSTFFNGHMTSCICREPIGFILPPPGVADPRGDSSSCTMLA